MKLTSMSEKAVLRTKLDIDIFIHMKYIILRFDGISKVFVINKATLYK